MLGSNPCTHQAGIVAVEEQKHQHKYPKWHIVEGCGFKLIQVQLTSSRQFLSHTLDIKRKSHFWPISIFRKWPKPTSFPHVSGKRWQFKNRLGDIICTGRSFKQQTQMPLFHKQYWQQKGLTFLIPKQSTLTNSASSVITNTQTCYNFGAFVFAQP